MNYLFEVRSNISHFMKVALDGKSFNKALQYKTDTKFIEALEDGLLADNQAIKAINENAELVDEYHAFYTQTKGTLAEFLAKGADKVVNLRKLTNKASSIEIPWKNLDDRNVVWINQNSNTLHTAKTFANETGSSLYDVVLDGSYYVKFDLTDGRILLGNTSGSYHAFGVIEDAAMATFRSSILNATDDVFNARLKAFLGDHANKLKVLSGATSRTLTIAGKNVNLSTGKVNTLLGRFDPDVLNLFDELGSYKNVGLGESPGGINLLNKPNFYHDKNTWWNAYNKPWLDRAINRGDDIYLATIPKKAGDFVDEAGKLKGAFAEELDYLVKRDYKPTNISSTEWNTIKSWFSKQVD